MRNINRTGETVINSQGIEMKIIEWENTKKFKVQFNDELNSVREMHNYGVFKRGNIRSLYYKEMLGVGYIGEGKYDSKYYFKNANIYKYWASMVRRCYSDKVIKNKPTYQEIMVCNEWHNFQNFAEWFEDNYYEIEGQRMCLDKDILNKGNKIYSPDNCTITPNDINVLFVKANKSRGELPIGVCYKTRDEVYVAQCNTVTPEGKRKNVWLGQYNNPEEAFIAYKTFKEQHIKEVADRYKDKIPPKLYEAMYRYEVEIDD